jgi:hypothetical protein
MPLDFPNSPTNGQTFGNYIYDASSPGWRNVNSSEGIGLQFKSGLVPVVPTSLAVGSGSATVDSNALMTFTGTSSFSVNGCFTSLYRSYSIYILATADAGQRVTNLRLRAGGADNSTTNWLYGFNIAATTGVNIPISSGSANLLRVHDVHSQNAIYNMDIGAPNQSQPTVVSYTGTYAGNGISGGGIFTGSNVFDGFTLFLGAGVMSGTAKVYGYN